MAVSTVTAANSATVTAPQAGPGAPHNNNTIPRPQARTVNALSAQVFGARSTPPAVVNAISPRPAASVSASAALAPTCRRRARIADAAGVGFDAARLDAVARDDTAARVAMGPLRLARDQQQCVAERRRTR